MSEQKNKDSNNKNISNAKSKKSMTTKKVSTTNKKKSLKTMISTKKNINELETIKANEIITEELNEYNETKMQKNKMINNTIAKNNVEKRKNINENIEKKENLEDLKKIDDQKKLDEISKELKADKERDESDEKRNKKYKKILINVSIAGIIIIYLRLIIEGIINIPTIQFITDLKVFSIAELLCSLVLLEISYKRDSGSVFLNAIEMIALCGQTLFILELYSNEIYNINIYIAVLMSVSLIYYLLKITVIALRNGDSEEIDEELEENDNENK